MGKKARKFALPAKKPASSAKKPASPARKRQNLFIALAALGLALVIGWANVSGLTDSYFSAFVLRGDEADEAVTYLKGLETDLSQDEQTALAALQADWDSWRYSRLRDEAEIAAPDGTTLHGYYYDEGSGITAIFLPRFNQDGTGDFLLGPWLNAATGCNILLPDPRAHGLSGGEFYSYGYREAEDLTAWMDWADEALGEQTFLLCGECSGANAILFAAASGGLDGRAAFAVAESPFASFREEAAYTLKHSYGLPSFPFLTLLEGKLDRAGLGFQCADLELSAALAGSSAQLPVLFLQSDGDAYVPPEYTRAAYAAYPGPSQLVSGGQAHGTIFPDCRDEIQQALSPWLP